MRSKVIEIITVALICSFLSACAQERPTPPEPVLPVPSAEQIAWHKMEMNAFIHFTTNTFTDREWGLGNESPSVFNPSEADPGQWVRILKETGFKGIILTAKHHDGFCLWPSEYTNHSVEYSPYKNGKGDIVKELSEACKKEGLKLGIYLSPWDRNNELYGTPGYITYYRNQLTELITSYGPVFEVWFDGANGGEGFYGGKMEKRTIDGKTYYDWPHTIEMVKKLIPGVIFFSDAGPGVRWVGNERGIAGETNWNTISVDTLYAGKPGLEALLNKGSEDGTSWVPAETDVSIRPGWFYHPKEDSQVKTPQQLFDIYLSSVGRGSTLLLNVPPDRRGLINDIDSASLKGFKDLLDSEFKTNLVQYSSIIASNIRGNDSRFSQENLKDENFETYWVTDDNLLTATIEFSFTSPRTLKYILLQEYINLGQRVKGFKVEAFANGNWTTVTGGTTIGYKRILRFEPVTTKRVRVLITDSKACPVISTIGLY